ncbi:tyrosine-type recombinase/integrase [Baaleninema simplex]|uniref:tyrosine-type recombinase/integrase n=1 Tax=Baaleninema simplex TaxID=2862350 RepID=UPI001FE14DBD|nr:tyrosine-type recombinase/integrase [Baaleninema simplex]
MSDANQHTWMLVGDDYLPVEPVQEFLDYLRNVGRSPNTVRSYAFHLKLYWEWLQESHLQWTDVSIAELADFMLWLRTPEPTGVASVVERESARTESTVNAILTPVCMLYDFHERSGKVPHIPLYRSQVLPGRRYKGFLHHITKGKPVRSRLLKLKTPKRQPKTLSSEQVRAVVDACHRVRDKFLLCLLHETGMRIGQALGLRHEDIRSMDNVVQIEPRDDNENGARSKSRDPYSLDVSKSLMELYTQYLNDEFMEILDDNFSEYVFVNLWDGPIGAPMTYNNVMALFRRIKRKTGIAITPHMLRHTHATELIRSGMEMAYVQKRLGHASIQTTIDTYVHVSNEDMKREYQKYIEDRDTNGTTQSLQLPNDSGATPV